MATLGAQPNVAGVAWSWVLTLGHWAPPLIQRHPQREPASGCTHGPSPRYLVEIGSSPFQLSFSIKTHSSPYPVPGDSGSRPRELQQKFVQAGGGVRAQALNPQRAVQ